MKGRPQTQMQPEADPRFLPAYSPHEAAHYLLIPRATLRSWVAGRHYPISGGRRKFFQPVIRPADPSRKLLSFVNLVEAHVLDAIRRVHQVRLPQVRRALGYLERRYGTPHPLAQQEMLTDGKDLFIREYHSSRSRATGSSPSARCSMLTSDGSSAILPV